MKECHCTKCKYRFAHLAGECTPEEDMSNCKECWEFNKIDIWGNTYFAGTSLHPTDDMLDSVRYALKTNTK